MAQNTPWGCHTAKSQHMLLETLSWTLKSNDHVFLWQVYAWGDNDHGQQGNGTTTVNRKPTLVQGLEGQKITRVACGSSHSVAWTTVDVTTPSVHEPVLFQTARDSLGASYLGKILFSCSLLRQSVRQVFVSADGWGCNCVMSTSRTYL